MQVLREFITETNIVHWRERRKEGGEGREGGREREGGEGGRRGERGKKSV